MKIGIIVCAVLIAILAITVPATAGPGVPELLLQVQGVSGERTPCMTAAIWPGTNVPFEAQPSQTAGYWYDEGTTNHWAVQYFTQPWPSGDFQWSGHIETSATDLRATHTFEWFRNSGATTDPRYDWWLIVYSVDTHRQVAYLEVNPSDSEWGTFSTARSVGGYDVVVAATPLASAVPEPSSLMALGSGLLGLGGFVARRRK